MPKLLESLIGRQIIFDQHSYILIEVLDNGPRLVFQNRQQKPIQLNQYGNASRRSPMTYTIHCLNEGRTDLHPVLIELTDATQQAALRAELLVHHEGTDNGADHS